MRLPTVGQVARVAAYLLVVGYLLEYLTGLPIGPGINGAVIGLTTLVFDNDLRGGSDR